MEAMGAAAGVAGLASLTIQLGDSAVKIQRLYSSLRDAPATLEDLALELQTVALHLRQLEKYRLSHEIWDDDSSYLFDFVVERCKRSVAKITDIANKLEARMARSKLLGRIYVSFKEAGIEDMWQRIEREKSSLVLICQLQSFAAAQVRYDDQQRFMGTLYNIVTQHCSDLQDVQRALSHVNQSIISIPITEATAKVTRLLRPQNDQQQLSSNAGAIENESFPSSNDSINLFPRRGQAAKFATSNQTTHKLRPQQRYKRSRKFSWWSAKAIWQLTYVQAQSGWTIKLQTWNTIPHQSEVFEMCRRNSISGVKRLICAGKASFFDVDEFGLTLADAAGDRDMSPSKENVAMMIFLLENCNVLGEQTIFKGAMRSILANHEFSGDWSLEAPQMLSYTDAFDFDTDESQEDFLRMTWESSRGNVADNRHLVLRYEGLVGLSLPCRFAMAMHLTARDWTPSDFLRICGLGYVTVELANLNLPNQSGTALHLACACMGGETIQDVEKSWSAWKPFVQSLIQHGANLHADSSFSETPMIILLLHHGLGMARHEAFSRWIQLLKEAQVDLVTYGYIEQTLQRQLETERPWMTAFNFEYGESVGDWRISEEQTYSKPWIPVYEVLRPPGTFPTDVPGTILWHPREQETSEGIWRLVRHFGIPRRHSWCHRRPGVFPVENIEMDAADLPAIVAPSYDDARVPVFSTQRSRDLNSSIRYRSLSARPSSYDSYQRRESTSYNRRPFPHVCWHHGRRFVDHKKFLPPHWHPGPHCPHPGLYHPALDLEVCRQLAWDMKMDWLVTQT